MKLLLFLFVIKKECAYKIFAQSLPVSPSIPCQPEGECQKNPMNFYCEETCKIYESFDNLMNRDTHKPTKKEAFCISEKSSLFGRNMSKANNCSIFIGIEVSVLMRIVFDLWLQSFLAGTRTGTRRVFLLETRSTAYVGCELSRALNMFGGFFCVYVFFRVVRFLMNFCGNA